MRALLIAVALVALGWFGFATYQYLEGAQVAAQERPKAAEQAGLALSAGDGATLRLFNDVCVLGRQSYAQAEGRAAATGWARAADDVHPKIARIMAISRGAAASGELPATDIVLQAYAHPQRAEYIVLTGMVMSGRRIVGCYVYDFAAAELPDLSALEAAQLGPPTDVMAEPGVGYTKKWVGPAALPSVATLRAAHFPEGSPVTEQLGFNGLLFALTSFAR